MKSRIDDFIILKYLFLICINNQLNIYDTVRKTIFIR